MERCLTYQLEARCVIKISHVWILSFALGSTNYDQGQVIWAGSRWADG